MSGSYAYNTFEMLTVYGLHYGCYNNHLSTGMVTIKTISERIKQIRKAKGLSQRAFCAFVGINRSTLAGVESKGDNPPHEMLVLIATKYTEISRDWLLTGEGEMYKTPLVVEGVPRIANHVPDCATDDEKQLLEEFRNLTDEQKADVLQAIHAHREFSQLKERLAKLEQDRKT